VQQVFFFSRYSNEKCKKNLKVIYYLKIVKSFVGKLDPVRSKIFFFRLLHPIYSSRWGSAFRTWTQMFESEFELEQVFRNFQSSVLTSFFRNFWKVWNRTNSELSENFGMFGNPCFWPKTPCFWQRKPVFDPQTPGFASKKQEIICELMSELFLQNFCEFEKTGYFWKISEL